MEVKAKGQGRSRKDVDKEEPSSAQAGWLW
jgi:hypothetical protein